MESAVRAQSIHRGMVRQYLDTGELAIRPTTVSFNAVINAWYNSRCKDASERTERILGKITDNWIRTQA